MQDENNTDYSGITELINAEIMINYNNFIVENAVNNIGKVGNIIDFGAGMGTLSVIFRDKFQINPICIEIDDANISCLVDRKLDYFKKLEFAPKKSDAIFSSNVLEHIEDDIGVLDSMKNNLKEGGRIYLYLPAKMMLWSQLDEAVGHYRRYEVRELKEKCERAGMKVIKIHYSDSVGFFASLFMKVVGYNSAGGIGSPKSLQFYDRCLFPISKILDRCGMKYLFGKNIILIAEK